jgi:hypothetical protein
MADQSIDKCPVRVPRRGVDNQPCGLVDDNQMCILETDIQSNGLRNRLCVCIVGEKYDEILAAADPQRRVAKRRSVARDMAGTDQPFQPGARECREMERKCAIKALPGLAGACKNGRYHTTGCVGFSSHDQALLSHRTKGVSPD